MCLTLRPFSFKCSSCPNLFPLFVDLGAHLRTHTEKSFVFL
ncbi:MAG: C2H2-type zinc finger protein [bacterium]